MNVSINNVGKFCKMFRMFILDLTLDEMSQKTGVKIPTLSSFENGRSSNSNHINLYYDISTDEQKTYFRENIPFIKGGQKWQM